jgi:hypothetical protein
MNVMMTLCYLQMSFFSKYRIPGKGGDHTLNACKISTCLRSNLSSEESSRLSRDSFVFYQENVA